MHLSKTEFIALIVALFVGLHFYNKYQMDNSSDIPESDQPVYIHDGKTPVIVAFGDSLTAGTGAGQNTGYPAQLSQMLGIDVINAGVSQERSSDAARRIGSVLNRYHPDIVLIEIGFDDITSGRKRSTIADNLLKIIKAVKKSGATPIVIGIPDPDLIEMMIATDLGFYEEAARKTGALYIPDVFGSVLKNEELKSGFTYPNAKGYRKAAETVYHFLTERVL
ncbi:GDSL-type esterase/lipase family protein [Hydrogenimonas sp. SS33]|uniref:GDSL-type esterase/lipase family protein n=1 Tax=Hydrogenimonas leucolamina TaxID=2954236 RepID=UPI00336BB96D